MGLTAVAASIVAVVGLTTLPSPSRSATSIAVRTAPGERRAVLLRDGTRIAMNGDTVLRIERGPERRVDVRRGQAFFAVAHDADRPFRVSAGDVVLQDVGTAFDVTHGDGVVDVAVRQGVVLYDPDDTAVRLTAGRSIHVAKGAVTERAVDVRAVGGWRGGRLVYRDERLDRVARDVARSTGMRVAVDRAVADRRFSGVVMIGADRPLMFRRLAAITGTTAERTATGWRLSSSGR